MRIAIGLGYIVLVLCQFSSSKGLNTMFTNAISFLEGLYKGLFYTYVNKGKAYETGYDISYRLASTLKGKG